MLARFAFFLLKRSRNAALVAFFCSVFPAFLGAISLIVVAFVTLRKGAKEGFFVLSWAVLPLFAHSFVDESYVMLAVEGVAVILIWGASVVLRYSSSWSLLLQLFSFMSVVVIVLSYPFQVSLEKWWVAHISAYIQMIADEQIFSIHGELSTLQITFLAKIAMGVEVLLVLLGICFKLALARFWESRLYKHISFKKEMLAARLSYSTLILSIVLVAVVILSRSIFVMAILIPLIGLYVAVGLCMLHSWMQGYRHAWLALSGFYVILVIFPYFSAFPLILGLVDSGLNLRVRMLKKKEV